MAKQVEIGRLAIKVTPDTSDFREQVKAETEKIERQLDAVEIDVELDGAQAERQATETQKRLEQALGDVEATVTLDEQGSVGEAKTLRQRIAKAVDGIKASVGVDSGLAMAQVHAIAENMQNALDNIEAQIRVSNEAMGELLSTLTAMQAVASANPVEVPVHAQASKLGVTGIKRDLQRQLGSIVATVQIRAVKDPFTAIARSTGLRMLWDLHRAKFQAFANFDKIAMQVGTLTTAVATLGAVTLATSGNLLSWGKDLASISALLIPLPGVLTGVGLAAWAMGNAFADADKYLPKLKSQFDGLKKSMSEDFWSKAQRPMQSMVDNLFPKFAKGMRRVSTESGKLIGALADGFSANLTGRLDGMMGNLAKSISVASKGMGDLSKGLSILLDVGMARLPQLAGSFNNLTRDFASFMAVNEKNGNITKWVDTAVVNFKALGSVLWNTVSILGGLADAMQAAGASTLRSLAATMERAAEVVRSGPFQAALTGIMTDIYAFTDQVGAAIGRAVSRVATEMMPMFAAEMKSMGPVLAGAVDALFAGLTSGTAVANFQKALQEIRAGIATLTPAFQVLGEKISVVMQLAGTAFKNLSLIVGSFVLELAVILEKVQGPATALMDTLGGSMKSVLDGLKGPIDGIGTAFATLLTNLQPVAASLGSLQPVVEGLGNVMASVFQTIANYAKGPLDALAQALPQLSAAFSQLLNNIKPLTDLLPSLGTILGFVSGVVVTVVMSALTGLINGINNVIEGVKNVFSGLIEFFTGIFTGDLQRAWDGIKSIFTGVWQAILGAFQIWMNVTLINILRGGLTTLVGLWQGGWQSVKMVGQNLWANITTGVRAFGNNVVSAVKSGVDKVVSGWRSGWSAVSSFFKSTMTNIIQGANQFKAAITTKFTEVKTAITTTISSLPGTIRGYVQQFKSAGQSLIEGVRDGILQKAGEVIDAAKNMARSAYEAVKSWWDINSPSKLFRRMAGSVPEGVAQGISRNTSMAVNAAEQMAKAVGSVPVQINDVEAPDIGKLQAMSMDAMGVVGGEGNQTVINQTFNAADMKPEDVYRELSFGIRQMQMSGAYAGGDF